MTNSKYKFEFDRLKMYFGVPYQVTDKITIYEPTIGDILEYGEKKWFQMLNTFITNTTQYRLQLWEQGKDWNKVTDFELFCSLIRGMTPDKTRLLFGDLNFSLLKAYQVELPDDDKDESDEEKKKKKKPSYYLYLRDDENDIFIDEEIYANISTYLRTMFNIFPKVEYAKGKATKEAIIDEERMNLENEKKQGVKNTSILLPLVSSCVNYAGFKYNLQELKNVGIVQFMDSVERIKVYESTRALSSGMYSGMCDLSKVDKKLFNFMRDLDDE